MSDTPENRRDAANIAIFWDIENVTPRRGSFFVDGLTEFAESLGKVVIQNAYADWSDKRFYNLGLELAQQHFYMVHLPYRRNQRSKNGADIQLVSDALDSLRVYGHIDTYVLITGDSDFRPLLRPLRRLGKTIHIICDIRNASQDLLMIADSFQDYHELLPSRDDDEQPAPKTRKSSSGKTAPKKSATEDPSYWFNQLCEAVSALKAQDKTINLSTLRIKMRMLNPGFNERKLGFSRWSQFIADAVKNNYIHIESSENDDDSPNEQIIRVIEQPTAATNTVTLQKAFQKLLVILQEVKTEKDKDADNEGYLPYGMINSRLCNLGINVQDLGFNQFKKFMASAEARGLVETKLENMNYSARSASDASPAPSPDKPAAEATKKTPSPRRLRNPITRRKPD